MRARLYVLVGVVAVLGVASVAVAVATLDRSIGRPAILVVLVVAVVVGNTVPFVVVRKGEGLELTFEDALYAVAFLLLPAGGVLVLAAVSTVATHLIRRRQLVKTVYNHGVQALAVSTGLLVQHAIVDPGTTGTVTTRELVGAGLGVLVFSVVVTVLTLGVISVASGERLRDVALPGLGADAVVGLMAVSWGLVAGTAARSSLLALGLCAVPLVMLRQLQHAERQRQHLDLLLGTAISTTSAIRRGDVEEVMLDAASESLRVGSSSIRREPPTADEIGTVVSTGDGDRWLVPGARHTRDPFGPSDQTLLDGLGAIASIALENSSFLDYVGRDPVTGLPSHALFGERLTAVVEDVGQSGLVAVLVVKISRLDVVKQTYGPVAADVVLAELAARLSGLADHDRHDDPVLSTTSAGYLDDGEFALAVPGIADRSHALEVARFVDELVRRPVEVSGLEVTVTVSIGVSVGDTGAPETHVAPPSDAGADLGSEDATEERAGELIRDALAAASRVARSGGGRIQVAEAGGRDAAAELLGLEAELRRALESDQLVVYYQPWLDLGSGRLVGAEALVRWDHPERGIVSPAAFVPLAEETGLVVALDRLVLTQVCHQVASWTSDGLIGDWFSVSVNMSARHLAEPDLVDAVSSLVSSTGIAPSSVCVEVTESGVMHDAASVTDTLTALRALGVQLAIDDFGTGYSSLLYLRDFPVDSLKIDRSFVDGMIDRPGDAAIVEATVHLGHALGLTVVAEGVETEAQLARLRALHCDTGQGYLWSRPVPVGDFTADWLRPSSPRPPVWP